MNTLEMVTLKTTLKARVTEAIAEEQKDQKAPEFFIDFLDQYIDNPNCYISDAIVEYCDGCVDIYYSELEEWLDNGHESVEFMGRAIEEGLVDMKNYDFYKHIQLAQYLQAEDRIYSDFNDTVAYLFVLNNSPLIDKIESLKELNKIIEAIYYLPNIDQDKTFSEIFNTLEKLKINIYSIIDLFNATPQGDKFILIDYINVTAFEIFSVDAENGTIRGGYRNVIIDDDGNVEILKSFAFENVALNKYDCEEFNFYEIQGGKGTC